MHTQIKCLCTSARLYASYSNQLGKAMNKVMSYDQPKKGKKKNSSHNPHVVSLPNTFIKSTKQHNDRRVKILNKVFMKYITDLMATGEVAPNLLGRGIEVTHVKVSADFNHVTVYWIAQNDEDYNAKTEEILKLSAGHLQHELSQLYVIGRVPPINFVKNKRLNVIREVEERLSTVDYGEGFQPSAHIISQKTPILKTTISEKVKEQLLKLDESNIDSHENDADDEEVYEIPLPEMRQNVMGLDHEYIFTKVKTSLSKAKTAEMKISNISDEETGSTDPTASQATLEEVSSFLSSKEEKEVFEEFLKKRRTDEKRKKRALPYWESKLEEEIAWEEAFRDVNNDLPVNDYEDADNHK